MITLQFCKANTPFEVNEREKLLSKILNVMGCRHIPAHHVEGGALLWMPPRKAINDYWKAMHTPTIFFFNYRKTRTLLTPLDNYKKTKAKKPKTPLNLRQKKIDSRCYVVIKL
jgi:hypothetical protein